MTMETIVELEKIKQLRGKYSHYCDGLELERFLNLFTEDAILEADEKHGGRRMGKAEIRAMMEDIMASQKKYEMVHLAVNPLIELTGENQARGRWYLLDYNFRYSEAPFRVAAIYHDQYQKIGEEWKFSHICLEFVYPYRWPENIETARA